MSSIVSRAAPPGAAHAGRRARRRPSSIASQSVTNAAPRVSGSAMVWRTPTEKCARRRIELEVAVAEAAAGRQNPVRRGLARERRHLDLDPVQRDVCVRDRRASPERDAEVLRPRQSPAQRIGLPEREPCQSSGGRLNDRRDRRPPAFADPRVAPGREIHRCSRVEDCDQISPARVGERVTLEVLAQTGSKRVLHPAVVRAAA